MFKKISACLVCAAAVLSLAGCGSENTAPVTNTSGAQNPTSSAENTSDTTSAGFFETKKTGLWDNIPEIPVTAEDAFKYEYNSDMGGMVITDYLKESPKVRIPDTLEDEPVVGVDLYDCEKQITELVMPDSVETFRLSRDLCKGLKYINIPESVTDIGSDTLANCNSLTAIYVADGNQNYFSADGMLYKKGKDHGTEVIMLCKCPADISGSVTVLDGTTLIGYRAFYCGAVTHVTVPGSVTKIDSEAFYGCGLSSITLSDGLTDIGEGAFESSELTSVVIPYGVTEIRGEAFAFCGNLTSITLPDSVTRIEEYAFKSDIYLNNVNIPDSMTYIHKDAFWNCLRLRATYKGKTYKYINYSPYDGDDTTDDLCIAVQRKDDLVTANAEAGLTIENGELTKVDPNLTEVTIPDSVTSISNIYTYPAFRGCEKLNKVTFGKGVSEINGCYSARTYISILYDCENLNEIVIPNGVTAIGEGAFAYCDKLEKVKLPQGLKKIGSATFYLCTSLKEITIPDSVTEISAHKEIEDPLVGHILTGYGAFDGCENIKVTYKGKTYDYAHIDDLYTAVNGD